MLQETLLDTAIRHFGQYGFEGASTRAIAAASKTAMSSITYHFGGKEGLYLAAADHIAQQIAAFQKPALTAIREMAITSREQAIEATLRLLDSFAMMMLSPASQHWARFIMREQQEPTAAFERLYIGIMKPIMELMISLIARARPDLDERQVRAITALCLGQAMILRAGRASVCRILEVDEIDQASIELLRTMLRANLLRILSETPQ